MNVQPVKNRFGIIGGSPLLDLAIDRAVRVAPTEISVLVTGESGSGKEAMPKIIHAFSARKHGPYIAVNCGAIPEGTVDSSCSAERILLREAQGSSRSPTAVPFSSMRSVNCR
jgi:DNA-binding NtrC family response regulator